MCGEGHVRPQVCSSRDQLKVIGAATSEPKPVAQFDAAKCNVAVAVGKFPVSPLC